MSVADCLRIRSAPAVCCLSRLSPMSNVSVDLSRRSGDALAFSARLVTPPGAISSGCWPNLGLPYISMTYQTLIYAFPNDLFCFARGLEKAGSRWSCGKRGPRSAGEGARSLLSNLAPTNRPPSLLLPLNTDSRPPPFSPSFPPLLRSRLTHHGSPLRTLRSECASFSRVCVRPARAVADGVTEPRAKSPVPSPAAAALQPTDERRR